MSLGEFQPPFGGQVITFCWYYALGNEVEPQKRFFEERVTGFEPATFGLASQRTTSLCFTRMMVSPNPGRVGGGLPTPLPLVRRI